jgi:hypothetical protein
VVDVVEQYTVAGRMGPQEFRACLDVLGISSPLTCRRLFLLLDREQQGTVASVEFAGAMVLCLRCARSICSINLPADFISRRAVVTEIQGNCPTCGLCTTTMQDT